MDYRLLSTFLAVAEERHFGRAAARLRIAQPAVSQQVRRLEIQLGGPLFVRTTRAVDLTPAGRVLLAELAPGLAQIDAALRASRATLTGSLTRLRLGFLSSMAARLIPRLVSALRNGHPDTTLELYELDFDAQLDRLRTAQLDLGLVHRVGAALDHDPGVAADPLGDMPLYVALPTAHPLAGRHVLELSELREETWVLPGAPPAHTYRSHFVQLCQSHGFTPRATTAGATLQAMLGIVAAGEAVCWAPATARAPSQQIAFVRLKDQKVTVHLIRAANPTLPVQRIVPTLTDAVREVLNHESQRPQ